ncbi:MAG TPA: cyclase family protein [Acidimicrobiales bacterium]|nr:cyclase family protein [Acidimicrobiales bacterium]
MSFPDHLRAVAAEVSNWGRWGAEDEIGTLNLIDDAAVQRGIVAARTGTRIPLAIRLDANGPQLGTIPGRINPLHTMVGINTAYTGDPGDVCFSDDTITMGLQAGTHWDALAHVSYDGLLYNGHPATSITAERGATRCGIHNVTSIVSRAILLDIAKALGVDRLAPRHCISEADLDAAVALAGVTPEPGDIVLVRTGQMALLKAKDREAYTLGDQPGLTVGTVPWLRRHDVAAVATDTLAMEVFPCEDPAVLFPVHLLHLRDIGLTQGQNFDLETLSVHCAADGVYEMLLVANPEPVTGGVGAPTSPVAIK